MCQANERVNIMKVRCYSDLHLDWYAHKAMHATRPYDPAIPSGPETIFWMPPVMEDDLDTVLILAGDLWTGTKFIEYAGFSWIEHVAKRFKQVLVVLGNHCYWPCNDKLTITTGATKCNNLLSDMGILNVDVLDCDTFSFPSDPDVLFIGATLWTDMNKSDPMTMMNMPNYMRYDSDIAYETGAYGINKFNSKRWVRTHQRHKDYIKHVVEQNRDKKIFVITHHIPLNISEVCDPHYIGDSGNAYYYSDLSDIILDNPHIKYWISGHTHFQYEYNFETCLMINNAVGYVSEQCEAQGLVKHKVFEI